MKKTTKFHIMLFLDCWLAQCYNFFRPSEACAPPSQISGQIVLFTIDRCKLVRLHLPPSRSIVETNFMRYQNTNLVMETFQRTQGSVSDEDMCLSADDTDSNEDGRSFCSTPPTGDNPCTRKVKRRETIESKCENEGEVQVLRLKINSRERRRMHDLNSALDELREVMPYANGPSVRKLSKIATLLLAKNYILMLNSSLDEMKKLMSEVYLSNSASRQRAAMPHLPSVLSSGIQPALGRVPLHHHADPRVLDALPPHSVKDVTPNSPIPLHGLPSERHVLYGRWPIPCTCSHCAMDSVRVSYSTMMNKYPSPLSTSIPLMRNWERMRLVSTSMPVMRNWERMRLLSTSASRAMNSW